MAFTMEVPDEAAIKKEVMEQVEPAPEEVGELQALTERNVAQILTLDLEEATKKMQILQSIESFGGESMATSAANN
jgi:hypothetical protein